MRRSGIHGAVPRENRPIERKKNKTGPQMNLLLLEVSVYKSRIDRAYGSPAQGTIELAHCLGEERSVLLFIEKAGTSIQWH